MTTLPAALAAASLNHLLRGNDWAAQRLKPFAGKCVRLRLFPLDLAFALTEAGEVAAVPGASPPDADIEVSPFSLLPVPGTTARPRVVKATGDAALVEVISGLLRDLRWDAEEDLSRLVGDVAAHRIGAAARAWTGWQKQVADNLAHALAEYLTEERPLIARSHDVAGFVREVCALRDAIARLEKRVDSLSHR